MIEKQINEAAEITPDPDRALKNLLSFLDQNPQDADRLTQALRPAALLFSHSQFLANHCISNPERFFETLRELETFKDRVTLSQDLQAALSACKTPSQRDRLAMDMIAVRQFKMKELLRITLRDVLLKTEIEEIMLELSLLADVVIDHSLQIVRAALSETYGVPDNNSFAVIALGKLGGEELNYSSDVDLVLVYGTEVGETSGIATHQGITKNRISNHEYYCKTGESLARFLSSTTEAGFAYRVDLRLRPEGQRGDIALALRGYETYYEYWGRAWERAMLIRARPVAGDQKLGLDFVNMVQPFVYRKYLDFSAIEEIRTLKTRIDSAFKKNDIKRGPGGIREIEFFAQALQLIYGGKEPLLRERSTLRTLHRLLQKGLMGHEDYGILHDNYRYLRTLEHRLQQLHDMQTHALPEKEADSTVLARKMGAEDRESFLSGLETRRAKVRGIYDSLFAAQHDEQSLGGSFFDEDLADAEIKEHLSASSLKDPDKAVRNIRAIQGSMYTFQTIRGRRLLGRILPAFIDAALKSTAPDVAVNYVQSFAKLLSTNESYLEIFSRNTALIETLSSVFAESDYLSKVLISRPIYLEMMGGEERYRKSIRKIIDDIADRVTEGYSANDSMRLVKQMEEIRFGLLFLRKTIGIKEVMKGLSRTAEAILKATLASISESTVMTVMGFGKLGGRELAFNSDLDLIFVVPGDVKESSTKEAEKLIRMLISYTREGIAYRVDTRLRPEGSKGPLVSSLDGFRSYYDKAAAFWEFQSLLKARPVAGDVQTGRDFISMARDILVQRGKEILASDIRQMRDKIQREIGREREGYDIKLGPGGIEEIEFSVQFLQLKYCHCDSRVLVQSTEVAIERLVKAGVIAPSDALVLRDAYIFNRTLNAFLKLKSTSVLKKDRETLEGAARFMGFEGADIFVDYLENMRVKLQNITGEYVRDSSRDITA